MQPASLLPKLSSPPLRSLSCFRCILLTSTLLSSINLSLLLSLPPSLSFSLSFFHTHTQTHTYKIPVMLMRLATDLSSTGLAEYIWTTRTADILICMCSALAVRYHRSTAVRGQQCWHSVSTKTGNEIIGTGVLSGVKQELKSEETAWWMVQYESLGVLCSTERCLWWDVGWTAWEIGSEYYSSIRVLLEIGVTAPWPCRVRRVLILSKSQSIINQYFIK